MKDAFVESKKLPDLTAADVRRMLDDGGEFGIRSIGYLVAVLLERVERIEAERRAAPVMTAIPETGDPGRPRPPAPEPTR